MSLAAMPTELKSVWSIYLLRCQDGRYYLGISRDVPQRFIQHCEGRGSRFTRIHGVDCLVGTREVGSRAQAMRLERRLKQRPLVAKLAFFGATPFPDDVAPARRRHAEDIPDASIVVAMTLANESEGTQPPAGMTAAPSVGVSPANLQVP